MKDFTLPQKNIPRQLYAQLGAIVNGFVELLQDNLVGIYLHGSLAMGCFNPRTSDIDFLVVINHNLNIDLKKEIIDLVLQLAPNTPDNDVELSIVLKSALINFTHPTPFVLHYSNVLREQYLNEPDYMCGDDIDPDLAAHFTVTYQRGICLIGDPISRLFKPVPKADYIDSLLYDLEDVQQNIGKAPIYYILNLCRIWQYLVAGTVSSKAEGGVWALQQLPADYTRTVHKALGAYVHNEPKILFNDAELDTFARFVMRQIGSILQEY